MTRVRASLLVLWLLLLLFSTMGMAPRQVKSLGFPKDFLWGGATSSHQVEGGNTNNDWYEWELKGLTKDLSGAAADHYNRYEEDFDLAKSLQHNSYRMSLEWSRIEPRQGEFNEAEVAHYRRYLEAARKRGLKTMVTLHHFTTPIWASRQGGFENPNMPAWFAQYTAFIVPKIGDLVDYWLTVNEPNVTALTGYVVGLTPPGIQDTSKAAVVLAGFLKSHAKAYQIIHTFYPQAQVSFAHHMRVFDPARWWHPGDRLLAGWVSNYWNNQLLESIKRGHIHLSIPFVISYDEPWPELEGTLDYVGINYYTRDMIKLALDKPEKFELLVKEGSARNDMDWEIYPKGLYRSIMTAASFGWPVIITENGLADSSDKQRKKFLCDHLQAMHDAIDDGADVRGYIHWALIDNWEWIFGFAPRFGLIEVDYKTQKRTVRPAADLFTEVIKHNSLAACEQLK